MMSRNIPLLLFILLVHYSNVYSQDVGCDTIDFNRIVDEIYSYPDDQPGKELAILHIDLVMKIGERRIQKITKTSEYIRIDYLPAKCFGTNLDANHYVIFNDVGIISGTWQDKRTILEASK